MLLQGAPGSGKSALMAMAARRYREQNPEALCVIRFAGASPASGEISRLLSGIMEEIAQYYDIVLDRERMANIEQCLLQQHYCHRLAAYGLEKYRRQGGTPKITVVYT